MAATSFAYKVRTKEGRVLEGKMDATGEGAVASRLRQQGMTPIQITKDKKASMKMEIRIREPKVKLKDLAIFSRQFATMINAGLSLLRSLNILAEQTENPTLAKTIGLLRDDIERGSSLSASMSKFPKVFSKLFVSMVKAGETGGQLDVVLNRVADGLEADYKLRQKVKSAMTYPVVVAVIAGGLVVVMLLFVVPTFAGMFDDLGGELPLPTKILLRSASRRSSWSRSASCCRSSVSSPTSACKASSANYRLRFDTINAQGPRVRGSVQQGRAVPLRADLGAAAARRRPRAAGARHRRGLDRQRGPGPRLAGCEGERQKRRVDGLPAARTTRCSRPWSCR